MSADANAPLFPTQQWLDGFKQALNSSESFRSAAKTWNDDALYVIEADPAVGFHKPLAFYMKWKDGEVITAKVLEQFDDVKAVFWVGGQYSAWAHVHHSKMEAGIAFLTGKFRFRGPFAKAALNIHGEVLMLKTAYEVPTRFLSQS